MPNLEKYLEIYLAKISKEHNVNPTSLDDLVEFRYKASSFNPELNAAINNIHPPVEKLYTIRDILLGRERKWLSENTNYKLDEVLGALYPTQYTKKIISEINSADIQNSYIVEMEQIKKNQEIKKQFYEFLEHVLTIYDKKDVLYYLLENNPLLLVFPDEDRGPKTGIDKTIKSIAPEQTPIALISLLTGECLRYPSFRDFKLSIIDDNVLNLWIKQHVSNYSEINPSQLKLFRGNDDFSFLFEDIINFNIKEADILIRSHNEALIFELFERFKDITFPYTFFTFLMGNIPGIVYGSVLSATPSFLQASISDTEADYKRYTNEGVMNIMAEILGTVIPEAFSCSAVAAVKAINLFVKYRFNRKILQLDKDIVTKLANDFHHKHNKLNIGLTPIENENRFLLEIKPAFNPNNLTINIPAAQYLTELQLTSSVAAKINNPAAEFDTSMIAITKFMSEHGMTDIRYRGIYIWHNIMDDTPINHIAVIGKKGDKNYVFDLTAHRFKKISRSSLDGPLILEESEWKNRYLLAFADSVVKYKDFVGEQMAASEFKKYSYMSATEVIDGTQILTKPDWYLNELSGQRVFKNKINYSINNNPIRDIVHKMYWYNKLPKDNNNYISEVLYNAKLLINKEYKQKLAEGLSRIQQNQAIENSQSLWLQVLHSYREINNMDELLLVKPGEIVFLNTEEGKLISMMISLGNGLFSSLENNKLCASLINNNGIIMAEQIGQFVEGQLERFGMPSDKLKIYAGQAIGSQVPNNSINEVVEQSLKDEVLELPEYMTKILKQANELTDEQATIFYQDLKALCTTGNNKKSIKNLLTNIKLIDNKNTKLIDMNSVISLAELPPGRLVAFYGTDYELKSMMVSLGEGQFVISHGARIGIYTEKYNGIVSASQFEDIVNGKFQNSNVISGSVNLQAIRQDSLLGKDSIFNLEGNTLFIKAQGVPTIVNYMDGEDFSNIIEGLAIKSLGFNNWQKVETIELQSCFGAMGSIPVAQVLANKLNKKVIAHPLSLEKDLVKNNLPSAPKAKIYEAGVYLSDDDLNLASEQSYKNNLFWRQLLLLFENTKKLVDSEKSLENGVDDKILSLIVELAKLISKKITVDDFLLLHPEYYGFNAELGKELIPRMDMLLKTTEITNANEFVELMIKVISLTSNSYILLDKFMGQSLEAIKSLNEYLIEDNFKK
jgi:hypothetical protein